MAIFFTRIDSVPVLHTGLDFQLMQWLATLVDTLNEVLNNIEDDLNTLRASPYTSAQIAAMSADLENGVLLYDTDLNVYVGKENGSLVQFTTSPYP